MIRPAFCSDCYCSCWAASSVTWQYFRLRATGFFICILKFKIPELPLPWLWRRSVCVYWCSACTSGACLKAEIINKAHPLLFSTYRLVCLMNFFFLYSPWATWSYHASLSSWHNNTKEGGELSCILVKCQIWASLGAFSRKPGTRLVCGCCHTGSFPLIQSFWSWFVFGDGHTRPTPCPGPKIPCYCLWSLTWKAGVDARVSWTLSTFG